MSRRLTDSLGPEESLRIYALPPALPHCAAVDQIEKDQQEPKPRLIRELDSTQLQHYRLVQGNLPRLRKIEIAEDEGVVYLSGEMHRWQFGPHHLIIPSPTPSPRLHSVDCVGIPFAPPRQATGGPKNSSLSSGLIRPDGEIESLALNPVQGPAWYDSYGEDEPFCRLHLPQYKFEGRWRGEYDSRWPGRAPCWRHEEFPYLNVAEVVDVSAGVRITARRCLVPKTMDEYVKPHVAVSLAHGSADERARDQVDHVLDGEGVMGEKEEDGPNSGRGREIQFGDEAWEELMGKGYIAGDERWIVGEDKQRRITILRF